MIAGALGRVPPRPDRRGDDVRQGLRAGVRRRRRPRRRPAPDDAALCAARRYARPARGPRAERPLPLRGRPTRTTARRRSRTRPRVARTRRAGPRRPRARGRRDVDRVLATARGERRPVQGRRRLPRAAPAGLDAGDGAPGPPSQGALSPHLPLSVHGEAGRGGRGSGARAARRSRSTSSASGETTSPVGRRVAQGHCARHGAGCSASPEMASTTSPIFTPPEPRTSTSAWRTARDRRRCPRVRAARAPVRRRRSSDRRNSRTSTRLPTPSIRRVTTSSLGAPSRPRRARPATPRRLAPGRRRCGIPTT